MENSQVGMTGAEVILWTVVLVYLVWVGLKLIRRVGDFIGGAAAYAGARASGDVAARTAARNAWLPSWQGFFRDVTIFMIVLLIVTLTGLVPWLASYLQALWQIMPKVDWSAVAQNFPQP